MSKKRKKKSPLRNDFTDALNVEMAERKIIERTQPKVEEPKVSLEKISVEETATEVSKVTLEKAETPKVKVEKISIEKVEEIPEPPVEMKEKLPIVEVKVDAKLEKRILKEADNTILDEKPKVTSPKTEKPRKITFRSKTMQDWEDEQIEEKPSSIQIELPKIEMPRQMSRPEKFGGVASIVMLVYAFVNFDKPLFFLAMALFANFLRYPIGSMFGKNSDAVSNALHTFSIVVFFGAILFLFTD